MKDEKSGSLAEKGLSEQYKFDSSKPLRGETSEQTQRPIASSEKISTDRGSFTWKQ